MQGYGVVIGARVKVLGSYLLGIAVIVLVIVLLVLCLA